MSDDKWEQEFVTPLLRWSAGKLQQKWVMLGFHDSYIPYKRVEEWRDVPEAVAQAVAKEGWSTWRKV